MRNRAAITRRSVGVGLWLVDICLVLSYLSGRLDAYMAFYLTCTAVSYVGGVILAKGTAIAMVQCADGTWGKAAGGFVAGCGLALPAASLNVSYGAHSGDAWVDQLWEPVAALVPGIAE